MPLYRDYIDPGGRRLSRRLDHLCSTLECLRERLHGTVAGAIGETIGGIVRDAALRLLESLAERFTAPAAATNGENRVTATSEEDGWVDPDEFDPWLESDSESQQRQETHSDQKNVSSAPSLRRRRISEALATGLQAASWWLRRTAELRSNWATFVIGIAVAGISYVGGPLASALLGLAGSATQLGAVSDDLDESNLLGDYYGWQ